MLINCKGKRPVGKENKGINIEKYNRFKKLKIKIIRKKRKKKKKEKKRENSTELQKSSVEADVYNNNKKYD